MTRDSFAATEFLESREIQHLIISFRLARAQELNQGRSINDVLRKAVARQDLAPGSSDAMAICGTRMAPQR